MENYRLWLQTRQKLQIPTPPCDPEKESSLIADAAAVALAVCPELVQTEFVPLLVTESGETRIDSAHGTGIRIAGKWKNVELFYDFVTERLLSENEIIAFQIFRRNSSDEKNDSFSRWRTYRLPGGQHDP